MSEHAKTQVGIPRPTIPTEQHSYQPRQVAGPVPYSAERYAPVRHMNPQSTTRTDVAHRYPHIQ
mgnify:CR=1 FL=1